MQKNITEKLLQLFASPILLHYTLPLLMLCLIIGTVAQKYIGLYEATQLFFASPFIWLGPLPLPGLPIILALISLNLAGKLIFKSPWTLRNSGIIITHIGALLLLVGGLLTSLFSTEGYIELAPNTQTATISDYHAREFAVTDEKGNTVFVMNWNDLEKGKTIEPYGTRPVKFEILDLCRNCAITKRENVTDEYLGMAQHMQLNATPLKNNNEENMGGVTLKITGGEEKENGIYVILEDIPQTPEIHSQEGILKIFLRKTQRVLPFTIELLDFKRDVYPGTDKPKSYESTVRIHDNGLEWQSVISMNAPLRYKGYTFFQSSFIATPEGNISVLAAVWNVGRTFPYIASLTMGFGILLHLLMRSRKW